MAICALEGCSKRFKPRVKQQRFCSSAHRFRAWTYGDVAPKLEKVTCARDGCRVRFQQGRRHQAYCSPSCRQTAYLARKKAAAR